MRYLLKSEFTEDFKRWQFTKGIFLFFTALALLTLMLIGFEIQISAQQKMILAICLAIPALVFLSLSINYFVWFSRKFFDPKNCYVDLDNDGIEFKIAGKPKKLVWSKISRILVPMAPEQKPWTLVFKFGLTMGFPPPENQHLFVEELNRIAETQGRKLFYSEKNLKKYLFLIPTFLVFCSLALINLFPIVPFVAALGLLIFSPIRRWTNSPALRFSESAVGFIVIIISLSIFSMEQIVRTQPMSALEVAELDVRSGNCAAAISIYEKLIANDPKTAQPYNNLAWILITCPNSDYFNPQRALGLIQIASEKENFDGAAQDTLACVHAALGDFEVAIETAKRFKLPEDRIKLFEKGEFCNF